MFDEIFSNINTTLQNTDCETISGILQPGLCHYLIFGLIIFIIGILIIISSKNLIKTLIGLEIMLSSVCINFTAANTFLISKNGENGIINIANTLSNNASEAVQSTIANSFAPIQNLNFTFQMPEGQVTALIIAAIGIINAAAFLGLICAVFFKFKNTEISTLCTLKSADCPTDKDLENESGL